MGNILQDLIGGKSVPLNSGAGKPAGSPDKPYTIFIQFDGDEPRPLLNNMLENNTFTLTITALPGPVSEIVFTDNVTGKVFKIFAKQPN